MYVTRLSLHTAVCAKSHFTTFVHAGRAPSAGPAMRASTTQSCTTVPAGPELTDSLKPEITAQVPSSNASVSLLYFASCPSGEHPACGECVQIVAFVLYSVFQALSSTHNALHSPENLLLG